MVTISSSGPYSLGSRTVLTCTVAAIPQVDSNIVGTFTWYSNGEQLVHGGRFEIVQVGNQVNELRILSQSILDINFTCSATTHVLRDPGRISQPASSPRFVLDLTSFQCNFLQLYSYIKVIIYHVPIISPSVMFTYSRTTLKLISCKLSCY